MTFLFFSNFNLFFKLVTFTCKTVIILISFSMHCFLNPEFEMDKNLNITMTKSLILLYVKLSVFLCVDPIFKTSLTHFLLGVLQKC